MVETGIIPRDSGKPGTTAFTIRAVSRADSSDPMLKTGEYKQFTVYCDEPAGMGGDRYPSPLGYAVLAVGF